jgi:transcription elongation factor Elf1
MRDYGGDVPCPTCGHQHHVVPRRLQGDPQLYFVCDNCGNAVLLENPVAQEIAAHFENIRYGLSRLRI